MTIKKAPECPKCGAKMKKWKIPGNSTWLEEFHWVCFNDDCPYYKRGWERMYEVYKQTTSYRCRMNPETGVCGPLPVWSPDAHKDFILPEEDEDKEL